MIEDIHWLQQNDLY